MFSPRRSVQYRCRQARCTREVVFRNDVILLIVVIPHPSTGLKASFIRRHPVHRPAHLLPIRIVSKTRRRRAAKKTYCY